MPTYADLNQRNPAVDPDIAQHRALYEGGKTFQAQLDGFLPQRPAEPLSRYALRKREAYYRNYLGPIVDYFAAMLFTSKPVVSANDQASGDLVPDLDDFYNEFRDDCDCNGADIDSFFKGRLTEAMATQRSWIRLDHADDKGQPASTLADFKARKLGDGWLTAVACEDVYDWDYTDSGALDWAIVHRVSARRGGISDDRSTITESWDYLLADRVDTYSITYAASAPPKPTDTVGLFGSKPHRFGLVPLIALELPTGLWVANRLASPQLAHFRLSNAQSWGMYCTCYAQPVWRVADPDAFNKASQTMGAGYGITIGQQDSVEWTAPPSSPFDAIAKEITSQKDEIFRIAHQMALGVDNNAASVGRSGESKQADAQATRIILLAYSRIVKETLECVYDLLSRARGDAYRWAVAGLDDFAAVDVGGLAEILAELETTGGIPSKTFNFNMKSRLAEALLPDVEQSVKETIKTEIQASLDEAEKVAAEAKAQADAMGAAALENAKNPKPDSAAASKLEVKPGNPPPRSEVRRPIDNFGGA